jgi:predicted nucleic acid-binding protein
MIILDTNVLSELIRPVPAQEVKNWMLERTDEEPLATTAITVMEIEYGLARLPDGARRKDLEERFAALTGRQFGASRSLRRYDDRRDCIDRRRGIGNAECEGFYRNGH